jgi:hypothetical protein
LIVRRLIVIGVALLLAVQVVRNAGVMALATLRPETAAKLWASHPSVEISLGLARIGRSARERKRIDQHIFAMIDDAAAKSPLSPEPFLVRGVQAQSAGDAEAAKRAFLAAQARDPRSLPAAYFLANYYFRAGKALPGLQQTVLLARLSPGGSDAVAPFVATYAQNPSNWAQMRTLFRSQPAIEDEVLAVLAHDPRNAEAVLAIADRSHRTAASPWLAVLLQSLVSSGDYQRARAIWSSVGGGGGRGDQLLYDASFSSPQPPPPFNWSLASSTTGLAERQPGQRLHVVFYGNEDGPLASELLLMPPGTYQLQMRIVGAPVHAESLRWALRCDKSQEPVASVGLDQASRGWTFQIPPNCPAQWLELSGRSGDVAQQSDVTITGLTLTRRGVNA